MNYFSRTSGSFASVRNSSRVKFVVQTLAIAMSFALIVGCSSTKRVIGGNNQSNEFNKLLKGNYAYTMSGSTAGVSNGNAFYRRAGTFVSDGNGHITSGSDDFVQSSSLSSNFTGTYTVASDGTGVMLLSVGSAQLEWVFTITSGSALTMIEFDSLASGTGGARLQDPATLAAVPSGAFVFSVHSLQADKAAAGSVIRVGRITLNSDSSVVGQEDVVRGGVFSSPTVTGSFVVPDSTGKGSLNLTDSSGFSSTYFFYVIDAVTLNLLETDADAFGVANLGIGRAESQSTTPFTNASLNNGFVFSSSGDTGVSIFGVVSVGAFTTTGDGNIVQGSYDAVSDGVPIPNADITGNYSVDSSGRASIILNSQATGFTSLPEIAWMISPSKAFYLVNIPGRAESGTLYQQQSSSFSNASLKGQFSFSMFGGDNQGPSQVERLGVATFDGNTALVLKNYFLNRSGTKTETSSPSANYAVAPNGRVTSAITGISSNIVMYMISDTSGYLIIEDPATEVAGAMALQVMQ